MGEMFMHEKAYRSDGAKEVKRLHYCVVGSGAVMRMLMVLPSQERPCHGDDSIEAQYPCLDAGGGAEDGSLDLAKRRKRRDEAQRAMDEHDGMNLRLRHPARAG